MFLNVLCNPSECDVDVSTQPTLSPAVASSILSAGPGQDPWNFYQYVSCPTRRGKTLDLCYGSTKGAFKSLPLLSRGSADQNCVYLLPTNKTVLKKEKAQSRDVKVWANDAVSSLQGCFDCTDWGMFEESCEDLDKSTNVVCSYSAFLQRHAFTH